MDSSSGRRRKTPVRLMPDETLSRIKLLVENSAPNPARPRLSDESEAALAAVEEKSAKTYAEVEETTHQLFKLAEKINNEGTGVVRETIDDDHTKKEG